VSADAWNAVSAELPAPGESFRGRAKVRRNHEAAPATVFRAEGSRVRVVFDEPVRAPAPGQALVVYDDREYVLGGGWITGARP
ncbi:MAG: tRNA 2-thiouridine(34) synthase MnmA, partial [Planctomycetes bacterium]|nr:tRNA 2-thiouridine(34) synthase MnmA [Planctomycetota bacterium]